MKVNTKGLTLDLSLLDIEFQLFSMVKVKKILQVCQDKSFH